MSGIKKPPKAPKAIGDKSLNFRVTKKAEPVSAKPSADQIRQLYMASPNVEWTPFAKSMSWSPTSSRIGLPIGDWIKEKRDILAREQAEMIAEQVFNHRSRWHSDVLKTLKEYPEANDGMLTILKVRLNSIIEMIQADRTAAMMAAQAKIDPPQSQFAKIKSGELMALAAAIKVCTESKHRSLLINDWSFKVAETFSDPKQFGTQEEKIVDMEWNVELIGGENLKHHELQELLSRYYDRPPMLHTEEEIIDAAKASGGGG